MLDYDKLPFFFWEKQLGILWEKVHLESESHRLKFLFQGIPWWPSGQDSAFTAEGLGSVLGKRTYQLLFYQLTSLCPGQVTKLLSASSPVN